MQLVFLHVSRAKLTSSSWWLVASAVVTFWTDGYMYVTSAVTSILEPVVVPLTHRWAMYLFYYVLIEPCQLWYVLIQL